MKNYTITVNGKSYEVSVEERGGASAPVTPVAAAPVAPVAKAAAPAASGSEGRVKVVAPMSGKILGIKVSLNQAVKKGDLLCILEAMKMQNEIYAPHDATVAEVRVAANQTVATGDALVVLG